MTPLAPFAEVSELEDTLQRTVMRDAGVEALRRASGAIRGYCQWSVSEEVVIGRKISQRRVTADLWLPTLWLRSVDALVEGGVTLTPGTSFEWDETGRVRRGSGYWTPYMNQIVVSYTHGYPDGDERLETVHDVCLAAAARLVANPMRHSSETTGNESWSSGVQIANQTLSDGERQQLDHLVLTSPL
jgi:hypothetical protein